MTEFSQKDNPITPESLRKQFLENDFTTIPDTLPENLSEGEAELYNKVIEFINDDWQEFAKEMGLKRPQICYSEDFIPEALRLRVSRIIANAIIKIVRDEKVFDNILTTFVLPQLFAPLVDLVENDKKIVDMLVKKFTQAEIAEVVGLSQSTVSRRLKKISALRKDF